MATEKELRAKLYKSFIEEHDKSGLIPISWLIYDCPRYGFYQETQGDIRDGRTTAKLWLGRAIHEKSFLKEKEIELRAEGIIGRIDEYEESIISYILRLEDNTQKEISIDKNIKVKRNGKILEILPNDIKIGDEIEI